VVNSIETAVPDRNTQPAATLRRAITLPMLVLYGLGVTIGAGIYVLVGATAARAGVFAPSAFLVAAFVMLFSACSFAELSGRFPQSAGEAAYVDAGFGSKPLTLITGGFLLLAAIVSAAAITVGSSGYVAALLPLPTWSIITLVVLLTGGMAAWGIVESVLFAAVLTVLEILGLVVVVVAGVWTQPDILSRIPDVVPPLHDMPALSSVAMASLLGFFAFIGFDGMVNIVEETENPNRNMPLGILLTLGIATLLYFSVSTVAVMRLPLDELSGSDAPISLLFQRLTGISPLAITFIAIGATLNGVVIQTILASRVLYGLGKAGRLPEIMARLNPATQTPVIATVLVSTSVLIFALFFPIGVLAERTTQIVLIVFILINAALIRMKLRRDPAPQGIFTVPLVVPLLGFATSVAMLAGPLLLDP
jgi:amino acid transporter